MFKKIALCAMLVLILAPASVMAAGQQGQAQGIGNEAGNCLNVQQQTASDTAAQGESRNGQGQSSQSASRNGDTLMLQIRSGDQTREQDQTMIRNMTRDQIRLGSDSVQQQDGSAESVQSRFGLTRGNDQNILAGFADQLGFQFRNMGAVFQALLQ